MECSPDDDDHLPSDIIFEILSRASLQTLGKCRLLSKGCNSLTYESTFMHLHCQRTRTISGYFIQNMTNNRYSSTFVSIDGIGSTDSISKPSLDFLSDRVKIEASTSQGILLCVNQTSRIPQYYVCKPSTKQVQVIPNPKTRYFTLGIALVVLRSNPLRYKIVRFSESRKLDNCYNLRCEIFDSDFWAWKQLEEVSLPYGEMLSSKPVVSAGGALHWLTTKNNIFAFDEDKDSWKLFPLPKDLYETGNDKCMELVGYEGKLALICMGRDDCMGLWVLTNYDQEVWNKRQTMSIKALKREEPYSLLPESFYNSDIALMKGFHRVIFYNFKDGSSNILKLKRHPGDIFLFQSDLEPSNLMGGHIQKYRRRRSIPRHSKSIGELLALSQSKGVMGVGCIIRDHKGSVIAAMAKPLPLISEVDAAEALALVHSLKLVVDISLWSVEVESDSSRIVSSVKSKQQNLSNYGALIDEVFTLLPHFRDWNISHVKREGNQIAHQLAKLALSFTEAFIWLEEYPPELEYYLLYDSS